eukprot:3545193-Prymnesium_polylepis.1
MATQFESASGKADRERDSDPIGSDPIGSNRIGRARPQRRGRGSTRSGAVTAHVARGVRLRA